MRLHPEEIVAIKAAAAEAFGRDAVVRLFGSRLRDELRGGDIDLHVAPAIEDLDRTREILFRSTLAMILDGEPVDVVVQGPGTAVRWIDRVAHRDGCVL